MYLSYYDLKEKPFQISADPKFLWLGEKHQAAFSRLTYGVLADKGFVVLTGDVGTGKTTLINALINNLGRDIIVGTVLNPGLELLDLFNLISHSFGLKVRFKSKGDFLIHFSGFLFKAHADGKKVLLLIDEAQRLNPESLEEIRLLSNIERQDRKLLNIFFAGQSEFKDILLLEKNRALRQRITLSYHIDPLTQEEIGEYIRYRTRLAGAKRNVFRSDAVPEVFLFSKGYPRLVNIICDHALLTGYAKNLKTIDAGVIKESANELQIRRVARRSPEIIPEITPKDEPEKGRKSFAWPLVSIIILLLLVSVGYFFYVGGFGQRVVQVIKNRVQNSNSFPASPQEIDRETSQVEDFSPPKARNRSSVEQIAQEIAQEEALAIGSSKKDQLGSNLVEGPGLGEITPGERLDSLRGPIESSADTKASDTTANDVASHDSLRTENKVQDMTEKPAEKMPPPDQKLIIRFGLNSAEIASEDYKELDVMASYLTQNPETEIVIRGYSDARGSIDYNEGISELRADIVKRYFLGKGCDPEKIRSFGMGPSEPIASNDTVSGRQLNRRVEIELIPKKETRL